LFLPLPPGSLSPSRERGNKKKRGLHPLLNAYFYLTKGESKVDVIDKGSTAILFS